MNVTLNHHLSTAPRARGIAIVIDVFRAFTVTCYAFAVEPALARRKTDRKPLSSMNTWGCFLMP